MAITIGTYRAKPVKKTRAQLQTVMESHRAMKMWQWIKHYNRKLLQ
jgi:hypothetical protein